MSDLSQLELEAQAIDNELNEQQFTQQESAPQPSLNANFKPTILKGLSMAVGLLNERVTFAKQYFNEGTLTDIADSLIKVADVENIDLTKLLGNPDSRLGAWLALAVTIGMPSFMFYLAYIEAKKTMPKQPMEKEVKATEQREPYDASKGFHA